MPLKQKVPKLLVQNVCGNSGDAVGLVQSVPMRASCWQILTIFSCLKEAPGGATVQALPVTPLLLLLPV